MKKPEMYLETPINDIVFEDRNQAYGAYQLRKNSSRFLSFALLIGIILSSFFTAYSLTAKKPLLNDMAYTDSIVITEVKFKDIPVVTEVLPPPPAAQEVVKQATTVFAEMQMQKDNSDKIDDVPTIESLKNQIIGTENIVSDVSGDMPIIKNTVSAPAVKQKDYEIYVGQMPEYVGGYIAMQKWLGKEISYPPNAVINEIEGTVYISFIVNIDGSISDAEVVKGIGYGCDEEALRAIGKMKNWLPGKQNLNPVRVKITIPIKFEFED